MEKLELIIVVLFLLAGNSFSASKPEEKFVSVPMPTDVVLASLEEGGTVMVSATVQSAPPQIVLSWPLFAGATAHNVYRKNLEGTSWGASVAALAGNATGYTDTSVSAGSAYEYRIERSAPGGTGYGYIYAGIEVPPVDDRGKILLLVDNTNASYFDTELKQLQSDLVGDGWTVVTKYVAASDSVADVKTTIKNEYAGGITAVFLLGHVPVPYSGLLAPDGHVPNHLGAWPADVFYGEMDGTWTDTTVNSPDYNSNIPGDGRYDQSFIPSDVDIEVGRVDLYDMPAFTKTEKELLKQYLIKDHNFRHGALTLERRGFLFNGFGGAEMFHTGSMRSFSAMFGASNITKELNADTWFPTLVANSYLCSFGAGAGSYTSASGVGTTNDFASNDVKTVFTMMLGSYFGDWNYTNSFLRAPLATTTYGLTCVWSGRPYWHLHHMALGKHIGYCSKVNQNNSSLYSPNIYPRGIHIALMGDPTLRLHPVLPVKNFSGWVSRTSDVNLGWTASTDTDIQGYNVYRSSGALGPFTKLNSSLITSTSYTDIKAIGLYTYMVKAVKLETSGSGTYYNPSQGIFVTINAADTSTPFDNVTGYPNPFTLSDGKFFNLINLPPDTVMKIYTAAGGLVRELKETDFGNVGFIKWDGKNGSGELSARGIYLYSLEVPGYIKTGKIALIK